jgi:hypothetical protein
VKREDTDTLVSISTILVRTSSNVTRYLVLGSNYDYKGMCHAQIKVSK